jgi:hypothetical protein
MEAGIIIPGRKNTPTTGSRRVSIFDVMRTNVKCHSEERSDEESLFFRTNYLLWAKTRPFANAQGDIPSIRA